MVRGTIRGLVKKVDRRSESFSVLTFLPEKLDESKVDRCFFEVFQQAEVKIPFYMGVVPEDLQERRATLKIVAEDGGIDISIESHNVSYQVTRPYLDALKIDAQYYIKSIF